MADISKLEEQESFADEYGGYVTEEDFCSRGSFATNKTDHTTEKGCDRK